MGRAGVGRAEGESGAWVGSWGRGRKVVLGLGAGPSVTLRARGGAGTLAENSGGGARKFCLPWKWVLEVRGGSRG